VEGAQPSSLSAESETPLIGAFLFAKLFLLRLFCQKKKRDRKTRTMSRLSSVEKSFDQTFSKVCAVEGAQPSSLSAESETPLISAFLFAKLFLLRPFRQKKKRNRKICVISQTVSPWSTN